MKTFEIESFHHELRGFFSEFQKGSYQLLAAGFQLCDLAPRRMIVVEAFKIEEFLPGFRVFFPDLRFHFPDLRSEFHDLSFHRSGVLHQRPVHRQHTAAPSGEDTRPLIADAAI